MEAVAARVDVLAPGVASEESQALRETLFSLKLQAVVNRTCIIGHQTRRAQVCEGPPRLHRSRAWRGGIRSGERRRFGATGPDVSCCEHKVSCDFALQMEIPLLVIADAAIPVGDMLCIGWNNGIGPCRNVRSERRLQR